MALVLRTGLANLAPSGLSVGLCKVASRHRNALVTQVSFITSREQRVGRPPLAPVFDIKNKKYKVFQRFMDNMEARFDENTKVIVVDGLPAVGKDKFARQLAEELEMTYIKPPSFDTVCISPNGFDFRTLNPKLPEDVQFFDIQSFLENPKSRNSAAVQLTMFGLRCDQYMDCVSGMLASGKGVVTQRCPYSDINFAVAMRKNNYISGAAFDYYKKAIMQTRDYMVRPHLVIYLDVPVSKIKDNIKKRNISYEVNSPALTKKYLQDLESRYKDYLRECSKYSHLLIYDWTTEGDMGVVVEDIERLDFDSERPDSPKFADWRYEDIITMKLRLADYTLYKGGILSFMNIPRIDVPEMLSSAEDNMVLENVLDEIPGEKYMPGFNPDVDKGILFKLNSTKEDWLPKGKVEKQE